MVIINMIAFIILLIGGLNWGLVGIFHWNLVEALFGMGFMTGFIYVLVLLSAIWLIISACVKKRIQL